MSVYVYLYIRVTCVYVAHSTMLVYGCADNSTVAGHAAGG